jgi:hypothetical protein
MSSIDWSIESRSVVCAGSPPKNNVSSDTDEVETGTTDPRLSGGGVANLAL